MTTKEPDEQQEAKEASSSMLSIDNLSPLPGARSNSKRLGRGEGSGKGKTSGKGHKGQRARAGASIPGWFEGGQMPLYRRVGKIGFRSRMGFQGKNQYGLVPLSVLARFEKGAEVTVESLVEKGFKPKKSQKAGLKIVGDSRAERAEVPESLTVKIDAITSSAKQAIEAKGGKVELTGSRSS